MHEKTISCSVFPCSAQPPSQPTDGRAPAASSHELTVPSDEAPPRTPVTAMFETFASLDADAQTSALTRFQELVEPDKVVTTKIYKKMLC